MSAHIENAILASLGSDGMKLLLLMLAAIALYVFARWASSREEENPRGIPAERHDFAAHVPAVFAADRQAPNTNTANPQEVAASFPFDPGLGRIRITNFFFEKLDAIPGPPDPLTFADELHVQLYDPDSGHEWWQSFFVASPQGLAEILRDKSWKYLYAPEILVFPRYNLEEIRRAVVSRIVATNEFFQPPEEKEESL